MAEGGERVELKFRIYDGTDIGHGTYALAMTVESLKKSLLSQWPKDKTVVKSINDVKLIHAGRILENSKTLSDARILVPGLSGISTEAINMHAVLQPPPASKKKIGKNMKEMPKQKSCSCSIL